MEHDEKEICKQLNTNAVIGSGTDIDDSTNVSGEEDTADWGNGRF